MRTLPKLQLKDLDDVWQAAVLRLPDFGIPRNRLFRFASYCQERRIAPGAVSDDHLLAFLAQRRDEGESDKESALTELLLRRIFRKLKEADPTGFNPPIKTDTNFGHRRREWEALDPHLKCQFAEMMVEGKVKWSPRTVIDMQNKFLSFKEQLDLAGIAVKDIRQIADMANYHTLRKLSFGLPAGSVHYAQVQYLFLARLVAFVWGMSVEIETISQELARFKMPGGISPAQLKAALALDDAAMGKLIPYAAAVIEEVADGYSYPLVHAQAALAIIICFVTSQTPFHVHGAVFTYGFTEVCSDNDLSSIIVRGRQVPLTPELEKAIADLRRCFPLAWPADGCAVFVKQSGESKGRNTVAWAVKRLGSQVGIKVTLGPLHLASIHGLLKSGMRYQDVCRHLGWAQIGSFVRRY